MTPLWRTHAIGILAVGVLLGLSGCDAVDNLKDRFKTCQDTVVFLENNPQSIHPVYILGPDEPFFLGSRLRPAEQRPLSLCLEKGDHKHFRVYAEDGSLIAASDCAASLSNYEAQHPVVSWTPDGLTCIGW
jgi:hypothetical protein